jgi:uncharacterized protein (DUF2249 family)
MNFSGRVDVREYERKDKQRAIFEVFDNLEPGQFMELINDHDPVRLKETRFEVDKKGEYTWEYLESGPEVWRIAIGKK